MKARLTLAAVLAVAACGYAQAAQAPETPQTPQAAQTPMGPKPCEELKSEIAAKLDAKGVQSYTLDIVAKDQDAEGKAVGSCEGGTKKIMYRRGTAAVQSPAQKPAAAVVPAKETAKDAAKDSKP